MNLKDAEILCKEKIREYGLDKAGFVFRWSRSTRQFGSCRAGGEKREITLSKKLVEINTEKRVLETILHELAHALDFVRNGFKWRTTRSGRLIAHDWKWRSICREIGLENTERCFDDSDTNVIPPKKDKYFLVHIASGKIIKSLYNRPTSKSADKFLRGKYYAGGKVSHAIWYEKKENELHIAKEIHHLYQAIYNDIPQARTFSYSNKGV